MAKIIEGNLILDDDTVFDESLEVHGSIIGKNGNRYNLTVNGNISARDMSTWDITAGNITARDITAKDIIAKNITAEDISAWDISAKGISANDITAEDIEALNIDTGNIKAIDIYAWNITALNIKALNINAWNISARNIDASFILCEKLEQEPGSTLYATKVINNRSSYKQSAIDNSQFIKQKQEICDACGQVLRGKESNKLLEKLK